jgi:hypothetical protein
MLSIETIIALNEEIAARAAQEGLVPFVPGNAQQYLPRHFPNIGFHEPPGWEKTETRWFVDKTGVGYDWEPALTWRQFVISLRAYCASNPTHGFAITEEGAWQIYITAFRPVAADK